MNRPELAIENDSVESLQAAYNRLFATSTRVTENESYSLAQPYLQRSVPSFASDSTQPLTNAPERG